MKKLLCLFSVLITSINLFAQTWTQVNSPVVSPNTLNSISFRDSTHGIGGGGSNGVQTFVKSANNGGVNWANAFPNCGDFIQTVQYFDPKNAFVLANATFNGIIPPEGQFMRSNDDATTFSCLALPRYDTTSSHQAFAGIKMFFIDTLIGYIVGYDWDNSSGPRASGQILKTIDGGQTWRHLLVIDLTYRGAINEVYFVNSQVGFALGDSLYRTSDGGQTWSNRPLSVFNGQTISSLYFSTPSLGWAAGNNGALFQTANGGQTWTQVTIYTSDNFVKVLFTDSLHGWVAGGSHIYRSTDGGANWLCADTLSATITDFCMVNNSLGFAVGANNIYKYSCPVNAINANHSICAGQSYSIGNQTFNIGGSYSIIAPNSSCGCDSVIHLTLAVNPLPTPSISYSSGHFATTQIYSNYQWLYNGAYVTGGSNQDFTPSFAGSYAVIVTDSNGCRDTSAAVIYTNIDNVNANKFTIYPNPVINVLTFEGLLPKTIVTITNERGEIVIKDIVENGKKTINISQLPSGIYFANNIKFVKQ